MNKTTDMTSFMKDFFAAFPVDMKTYEKAAKNSASLSEKLAGVGIAAVEKNVEISNNWTKKTLGELSDLSQKKSDAAEFTKSLSNYASSQAEVLADHIAAYAEVAKKAQMEAFEAIIAAGESMSDEASTVIKSGTKAAKAAATAKPVN